MTWFKLDDQSAFDEKVIAAGNEAWGAFCRVGSWCSAKMTDGRFSYAIAVTVAPKRVWDRLVEVGLIQRLENGEMLMVKFLKWNPSAAQVLEQRKAASERMHRVRSPAVRANNDVTFAVSSPSPIPSRPDPEPIGSLGAAPRQPKRASALPPDWEPTDIDVAFARKRNWSAEKVAEEALRFASHHQAKGSVMKDWAAAWRTWVLNAHRFAAPPRAPMQSGRFRSSPPAAPTMTYKEFKSDPPPPLADGAKQAEMAASIARIGRGGT